VSHYGTRDAPGHSLGVIDVERGVVARTIDIGQYRRPHGMAFLPGDSVLAVTSEASKAVLLVDLRRDSVVATIPTNAGGSHMLALAERTGRIYTSNVPAGSITEQDVTSRSALRSVAVAPAVEGIAVTPAGDQVWVGSNEKRTVSIVDVQRGMVADTLGGFGMPYRLAVTPDGKTAVITDPPQAQVRVVDVATRRVLRTVAIPAEGVVSTSEFQGSPSPEGVALSRDGRTAFVTLQGTNRLALIDLTAGQVLATVPVGAWPDGVGYSPRRVSSR
jgi:YVTN family beta-propeller protein